MRGRGCERFFFSHQRSILFQNGKVGNTERTKCVSGQGLVERKGLPEVLCSTGMYVPDVWHPFTVEQDRTPALEVFVHPGGGLYGHGFREAYL